MSLVFFGTTDTGWHCLQALVDAGVPISGIITGSREFEISYAREKVVNLRHRSFDHFTRDHDIPVYHFERRFDEQVMAALRGWQPRLIVVAGWYYLIPERVRVLAVRGTVGVHWSLLPKYRGGSPLVWAMINGEHETGVSLFHMENTIDTGPIVGQAKAVIEEHDDVAAMIAKLNALSGALVAEQVPLLLAGTASAVPQNETEATYLPPRSPEDGRIDWRQPARQIYNFIRAQTRPYPCAFTEHQGQRIRILSATLTPHPDRHVRIRCGDGNWLGLDRLITADDRELVAIEYFKRAELEALVHEIL